MRRVAVLSLGLPLFAGLAAADVPSAYRPLEFLAGHCWKGDFPGGKQTDVHCFSWIYDSKFLRDQHTLHSPGHPDALGESIYFWDSVAKQIQYLYIESGGGVSRGAVSAEKDALIFPDTHYVDNGKTVVYRSRWQHIRRSAYDVVTEFQSDKGWSAGFSLHMEQLPAI